MGKITSSCIQGMIWKKLSFTSWRREQQLSASSVIRKLSMALPRLRQSSQEPRSVWFTSSKLREGGERYLFVWFLERTDKLFLHSLPRVIVGNPVLQHFPLFVRCMSELPLTPLFPVGSIQPTFMKHRYSEFGPGSSMKFFSYYPSLRWEGYLPLNLFGYCLWLIM